MTPPLFEVLEVLDDPVPHGGPSNMALDEILLECCAENPVLRIYRWSVPTVSIGYFEPFAPARALYPDQEIVRRWTGGGIVEHGADLTYSLLVPRAHPFARCGVSESYRLIHGAVATAMRRVGRHDAALAGSEADAPEKVSRSCFENPVQYDLIVDGQKVAGAAQRRTRHGLLHQGSIQQHGEESIEGLIASLWALLPHCFGITSQPRTVLPTEKMAAEKLVSVKYGNQAWLTRV